MDFGINPGIDQKLTDPDLELVREFNAGRTTAFDSLYHRHSTFVYNTCLGMLGDPDDARDAMQNTFIQAFRSLPRFRGQSRFSTWLYRIAVHKCMDLVRRRPKWESADALDWVSDGGEERDEGLVEEQVRRAILRLKPEYSAVLVLYHFQDMSYDEMAESLGISADRVRVRLHRARKAFRVIYAEGDGEIEV